WTDRIDVGMGTLDDLIADLTMAKQRRDPAGDVLRSFRVSLGRLPTINEIRAWEDAVESDTGLQALNEALITSEAFAKAHGDLTDAEFVRVIYDNAIGQPPTERRMADWLEAFADGDARATLPAYFADSYSVKDSTWHDLEVVQAFRAGLDRMPTDEEFQRWEAHLDGGGLIPEVVAAIRADR
ncbi:MAG: DUF4214 domain-containing protein, partial [Actinomycetota bacterium]